MTGLLEGPIKWNPWTMFFSLSSISKGPIAVSVGNTIGFLPSFHFSLSAFWFYFGCLGLCQHQDSNQAFSLFSDRLNNPPGGRCTHGPSQAPWESEHLPKLGQSSCTEGLEARHPVLFFPLDVKKQVYLPTYSWDRKYANIVIVKGYK